MHSNSKEWKRIRNRVLVLGESRRSVAKSEGMSRNTVKKMLTHEVPPKFRGGASHLPQVTAPKVTRSNSKKLAWMQWRYNVDHGDFSESSNLTAVCSRELQMKCTGVRKSDRDKAIAVLAADQQFSCRQIAMQLRRSRNTVKAYLKAFKEGGPELLFSRPVKPRKADDERVKAAIFALLHEPPSLHDINRTTWRMSDLHGVLRENDCGVCKEVIHTVIKEAGYRWRSAKVVLTSTDPSYREKLQHLQNIQSNLQEGERFFSIDEYGPFAIKMKGGRVLAEPSIRPFVPQWQKSKGWLIVTAALELSTNQVTHFYSRAKNTLEMIKLAEQLVDDHAGLSKLYLSWDAASWHMSKGLKIYVSNHNSECQRKGLPLLELAPLPASAQFLNVIESVFSGMARAIIHCSDYQSVAEAQKAIDRYFGERNQHFRDNPKRAGNKIWGLERSLPTFLPENNCKDPAYR